MKIKDPSKALVLVMTAILAVSAVISVSGEGAGTETTPTIDIVDLSIENKTSILSIDLDISGTAPAGTDHVNLTLGMKNDTMDEILPFWIETMSENLFTYAGISFGPKGPSEDPWTEWKLTGYLNIPLDMDPQMLLALLSTVGGFDMDEIGDLGGLELDNLSLPENISDISDISDLITIPDKDEVISYLDGVELLVVARAVNADGTYTETRKDVKMELVDSVYDFLITEGYRG